MKQKKFSGVYEYYRATDHDKATVCYYINVRDEEGNPKKIKTNAATPEEAVAVLAYYKVKRTKKTITNENKLTYAELSERFFNQRTTANNDKDKNRYTLHIKSKLGKILVSKISRKDIQKLQTHLVQKEVPASNKEGADLTHLAPKTINNITDLATRILNWAYYEEILQIPIPKIKKLSVDNERQRVFTPDEMTKIFASTEGDTRIFVQLMYYTAQRPESILRLKKKHVLNGSLIIESIKKQNAHMVPIAPKLAEVLEPWIDEIDADDYIISKCKSAKAYQTMSGRLSKIFEKLFNSKLDYKSDGVQWASMYTLRHTALTNIYAHTSDIYSAQAIANHSSVQMTQRYAKRSEQLKINAIGGL